MHAAQVVLHVALVGPPHALLALRILAQERRVLHFERLVPAGQLLWRHALALRQPSPIRALQSTRVLGRHNQVVVQEHVVGDAHLLHLRHRTASLVIIKQGRRLRDLHIVEQREIFGRRLPVAMRRLVLAHQQERAIFVALVQPLDRQLGGQIGCMAFDPHAAILGAEVRVVVVALTGKNHPLVEALRIGRQVPFANQGRLVADLLQQLRKRHLVAVKDVAVAHEAIRMAMQASQDRRARWPAESVAAEVVAEQ